MKIKLWMVFLVTGLMVCLGGVGAVRAQSGEESLTLSVNRNFGYSSGSQIKGNFTLTAIGPKDITSVTFTLDGEEMGTVRAAPWKLKFETTDYSYGWHELAATATLADGRILTSAVRRFEFATPAQEQATVKRILGPIGGMVIGLLVVMLAAQFLSIRQAKRRGTLPLGQARSFGVMGGTICPKCGRPFGIHWWGLNAGVGKFDRCEHCGKWSIVRRRSSAELEEAIRAEVKLAEPEKPILPESKEEQLRRQLDHSRYVDKM